MDVLIKLLVKLDNDDNISSAYEYLDLGIELVADISRLAESLLIDKNGQCDWDKIDILKSKGYYVFPVERDRYGWLIGGINTKKGVITYG